MKSIVVKSSLVPQRPHKVATVREKYLENKKNYQVRKKSGNFVAGQGNLERTLKVREFENKWLCSLQKIYLFCLRGVNYIVIK